MSIAVVPYHHQQRHHLVLPVVFIVAILVGISLWFLFASPWCFLVIYILLWSVCCKSFYGWFGGVPITLPPDPTADNRFRFYRNLLLLLRGWDTFCHLNTFALNYQNYCDACPSIFSFFFLCSRHTVRVIGYFPLVGAEILFLISQTSLQNDFYCLWDGLPVLRLHGVTVPRPPHSSTALTNKLTAGTCPCKAVSHLYHSMPKGPPWSAFFWKHFSFTHTRRSLPS